MYRPKSRGSWKETVWSGDMPVTATLRILRQEDCGAGGQSGMRKGKEREASGRGMGKEEDRGWGKSPNPKHLFL